jgi:hypothetical protein
MRKLSILFIGIFMCSSIFAQSPEMFNYQAVARNASEEILSNQVVSLRISVLQTSISGAVVYSETFETETNLFGLVNVQIGSGDVVNGVFENIIWSNDAYFLKVEMDINGGTSYEEYGISQLISVPYALHAKTADTIIGAYNETDPVFDAWDKSTGITISENQINDLGSYIENETDPLYSSSIAASIAEDDTAKWNSIPDKHYVGEIYGGGIVYWVDETGMHGLIVDTVDADTSITWRNEVSKITDARADGIGAGAMNTAIIVAAQVADNPGGDFAAKSCAHKYTVIGQVNGFDVRQPWYLPSKNELGILYQRKDMLPNLNMSGAYYSSTENSTAGAWYRNFDNGHSGAALKWVSLKCRCVKKF